MCSMRLPCSAILLLTAALSAFAAQSISCISADEASRKLNKDICISVHVYDVVQLANGTRFLDICSPVTPDERCPLMVVSLWGDHDAVGELRQYRDANIHIRGIVQPMHGRAGLVLSHARQFRGGPPRFRPNPRLLHGFSGEQERPPITDPNLRPQGRARSFMNRNEQELRPPN